MTTNAKLASTLYEHDIPPIIQRAIIDDKKCNDGCNMDELWAAFDLYLLRRSSPQCVNCGTEQSCLWRRGPHVKRLKKYLPLCNACGLKFAKGQYCKKCGFVYHYREHSARGYCKNCLD